MEFSNNGTDYKTKFDLPIHGERSAQFLLVCLLCGTVAVRTNGKYCFQKTNFTTVPSTVQQRTSINVIQDFLAAYDFGIGPADFIIRTLADNRNFYQELIAEFSQYFQQTSKGAHTSAFVFLYRILERLSYSVPLLYVSISKDFIGTFNELKKFIVDEKGGELGFFKLFLSQGNFIDANILDSRHSFQFISAQGYGDKYFTTVNRIYTDFEVIDSTTNRLECKFRNMPELLKTVRNRFFHTRTGDGQYNISLGNLRDPDEFFQCINKEFCSFLSIVSVHTLAKKYQH